MRCPTCLSEAIVKNGSLGNGKPKFRCNQCGRQFVENPKKQPISDEKKALIDKLLLEKISLAGIARVMGVSEKWLQDYVNKKYDAIPRQVKVKKRKGVSRSNVMSSGALLEKSRVNSGFGSP